MLLNNIFKLPIPHYLTQPHIAYYVSKTIAILQPIK